MYNGQIISELLNERGRSPAELLTAIGLNPKTNSIQSIVKGNPTVKRIEAVADFFDVSMDTFFSRDFSKNGINIKDVHNSFRNINLQSDNKHLEAMVETLKELIAEKDRRIELLEEINNLYKSQLSK